MPTISEKTTSFIGWRPYIIKTWDTATNKLLFKELLTKNKILTPVYAAEDKIDFENVIIKPNQSSFGKVIKGPIAFTKDIKLNTEIGEYYE